MNLFNFSRGNNKKIEVKSIPTQVGMFVDTYVQAPLTLRNNPIELIGMNKGYVYICNRINSQAVASVPFKLFTTKKSGTKSIGSWVETKSIDKKEQKWIKANIKNYAVRSSEDIVEIVNHPFLDLMSNVSDIYDYFTLMENTESYLGLIGNAFWYIIKDNDGLPSKIELLPSEYVSVRLDSNNNIIGYRIQIDASGYVREYEKDEILHFKQPQPGGFRRVTLSLNSPTGLYGMGSLEAVKEEAQLMESINIYERAMADNNGRPDYIVRYTKGSLEETQQKKLSKQWNQVFKGMKNSGKTAILDDQFEIKELGFNPKDLAFQEGKKYLRTTITNAFGVHENFVSVENANRASSETAIEQYYRFTILPKLRRFQEVINQNLLTKYDDNLWMCFDDPTPENADSIMKKDANDISLGIMSINEKRLERGLEVWDEKYDRPIDNNKTNKTNVTNITEDTDIIEG